MKQITNGTIEVNGTQCVLLDERAKEGVWVDPKDLTKPKHQYRLSSGGEWHDVPKEGFSFNAHSVAYTSRFKQPDRMELITEGLRLENWVELPEKIDRAFYKLISKTRHRFILKDQEQEPKEEIKITIPCPVCLGAEYQKDTHSFCPICQGEGFTVQDKQVTKGEEKCGCCNGTGYINRFPMPDSNTPDCGNCKGSGTVPTPNTREGKTLAEKALKEHSKKTGIEYNSLFSDGFIEGYECQASNDPTSVKPMPYKSLQACKDEVAKAWQYESWEQATKITSLQLLKYVQKLNDEAAELYLTSNQSNGEGWVKVEDRLPENRTNVLIHHKSGATNSAHFKHGCFWNDLDKYREVTHWQPLPSPPKQ